MCLCSGTQYQTLEPHNTSRLSRVDGQNDFQPDFSIMVLTTNDLPPRGPLPPRVSSFISRNGFYICGCFRGGSEVSGNYSGSFSSDSLRLHAVFVFMYTL